MNQAQLYKKLPSIEPDATSKIAALVKQSFDKIAPFWPLKNLIAVNPLQGFEDIPFEEALANAAAYFQQQEIGPELEIINTETIKFLQVYFDAGQATINMPNKELGLYSAWRKLALYDAKLHKNDKNNKKILLDLPDDAEAAIEQSLLFLNIEVQQRLEFLMILLTTLHGWASYVKYSAEWSGSDNTKYSSSLETDYLAIRLIITRLLWPQAKKLLTRHKDSLNKSMLNNNLLAKIQQNEKSYGITLLNKLARQPISLSHIPQAQFVFCIDVRSEPFRKSLEATGDYQTFGFAGFFGIPVLITDTITNESYPSCPVLLKPKHEVSESPCSISNADIDRKKYNILVKFKQIYQALKYNFVTPFALVEGAGFTTGIWMWLRSLAPIFAFNLKNFMIATIRKPQNIYPSVDKISFAEQCNYAEKFLQLIGLTNNLADVVVLCGHGSSTQNNAYATALDCGACGGRHGASNARILATILNNKEVRMYLYNKGIIIPQNTLFIAAEHNTTTDEVVLYSDDHSDNINQIKQNLDKARSKNCKERLQTLNKKLVASNYIFEALQRSQDWAQVRPEWGLARNAAFIIAPRDITKNLELNGRCFLHSYDYKLDKDGGLLTTILTAPMVVAQWINAQYLFSSIDNVAFGSGSKITHNITGKIGIIQGNASDLMTGLPLQSVYSSDTQEYHVPQRLLTVVFATRKMIDKIINEQPILQKLFANGWVQIACIEPYSRSSYLLDRSFSWRKVN